MKIDPNFDYEALLLEAQTARRKYNKLVDSYRPLFRVDIENGQLLGYPDDVKPVLNAAREQWEQWVKVNIHDRGLELWNDMLGNPIAITAVLAGKKI